MKIRAKNTKIDKFNGTACITMLSSSYDLDMFLNAEIGDYCMFMSRSLDDKSFISIPFDTIYFFSFDNPHYRNNLSNSLKIGIIVDKFYYTDNSVFSRDKLLHLYPIYKIVAENGETVECRASMVATNFYESSKKIDFIIKHIQPYLDKQDLDKQKIFDSLKDSFYKKQNEFKKLLTENK